MEKPRDYIKRQAPHLYKVLCEKIMLTQIDSIMESYAMDVASEFDEPRVGNPATEPSALPIADVGGRSEPLFCPDCGSEKTKPEDYHFPTGQVCEACYHVWAK